MTAAARSRCPAASSPGRGAGGPSAVVPAHVAHCAHGGARSWWIYTWKRDAPEVKTRTPYTCGSWRCPVCRKFDAHQTYARIMEAMQQLDRRWWCFVVLTLDRDGTVTGKRWPSVQHAFRALSRMSRNWFARLRKNYGIGKEWISVVEAHRSGWPHVNFLIWDWCLAECVAEETLARQAAGETVGQSRLLSGYLLDAALASGWGPRSTIELAQSPEAVASYACKLAGEGEALAGELAKFSQLPINAPPKFRRLRSGKNFLPPRRVDPTVTGTMVRRFLDQRDGSPMALPLHSPSESVSREDMAQCCELETQRLQFECETEHTYRELYQRGDIEAAHRLRPLVAVAQDGRWT